jgi:hypothetical protein
MVKLVRLIQFLKELFPIVTILLGIDTLVKFFAKNALSAILVTGMFLKRLGIDISSSSPV